MSLELKRKFLLKDNALLGFLSSWGVIFKRFKAQSFCINYTKFLKIGEIFSCSDGKNSQIISKYDYQNAKTQAKNIINKEIFSFKLNGNICNIELYSGDFSGLYLLEIIFSDELYGVFFKPPAFLSQFIAREVTLESAFCKPEMVAWQMLDEHFDFSEAIRVFKSFMIVPYFPKNLRVKDAVCVLLYCHLLEILTLKDELETSFNEQKFLEICDKFESTKATFALFKDVFDEKTAEFFLSNFTNLFCTFEKSLKILNALMFLDELKNGAWLEFFFENAFELEVKNAKHSLKNENFLKDWELFLSDTSDFFATENFDEKLICSLAKRSRVQALKAVKNARTLNEQSENSIFFALFDELRKLEILLTGFYGATFEGKILERTQKLLKKLKTLKEFDNVLNLVQKLPQDNQADEQSAQIYAKIYKLRKKILKSVGKFIVAVLKSSKELKIYYKV